MSCLGLSMSCHQPGSGCMKRRRRRTILCLAPICSVIVPKILFISFQLSSFVKYLLATPSSAPCLYTNASNICLAHSFFVACPACDCPNPFILFIHLSNSVPRCSRLLYASRRAFASSSVRV